MKFEWRECTIGDLGQIVTGKTPSTKKNNYWGGKIMFITPKDIQATKHILKTERHITDDGEKAVKGVILPKDSICVSCIGNIGYLGMTTEECVSNQQINSIIVNNNNDVDFVYYLLKSLWAYFKNYEGQSTALSILNKTQFSKIKVQIPSVEIQKKISSILSGLDNKIELNNKINNNLEQQAQAIFKSWFIDYEPFDGQVPTTWKYGVLGDFVEIKRGGSPRPIQNFLSDSGLHWLKISDATGISSPFINEIKEYIIEEGLKKTVFLKSGSLVLSNSATPGLPKILDIDTCIHDGWLYFPSSKFSNEYLYLYFKHIRDNLVALGNGSVFTNLKTDILKNYPTNLPTDEVLNEFDEIIKPIFSMILSKTRESKRLTEIRDTLLPRLMSRELDVFDIDL